MWEARERGEGRWLRPTPLNPPLVSVPDMTARLAAVTVSWNNAFHLREGRAAVDGKPAVPGLRRPQIGALHAALAHATRSTRSEEHTSELQSLMRISYAVFCLHKKKTKNQTNQQI